VKENKLAIKKDRFHIYGQKWIAIGPNENYNWFLHSWSRPLMSYRYLKLKYSFITNKLSFAFELLTCTDSSASPPSRYRLTSGWKYQHKLNKNFGSCWILFCIGRDIRFYFAVLPPPQKKIPEHPPNPLLSLSLSLCPAGSVADPYPGSGAFFTPGPGIRDG
jgi:hypothetical protein